ncbi:MAG TPA: PAS domain S-box protein, partial [Prolixibacteraceae bacterium]|nr:PAS domain S-box protein [Prolixibacteraceae bacterium]
MHKIISDLFLLTTNLTQLKNRKRVVDLFVEGVSSIFDGALVVWHEENQNNSAALIPVCTRKKTYGYIETDNIIRSNNEGYPYFQNAVQLLAIILERIEQENALEAHQKQLKDVIYQQTRHLIEKHDELAEANEELATANEELTETNRSLIDTNNDLEIEVEKREEVEKKLRDSNKFFNHASDMLCIAGFDGYFKVLNPAWEKVLGWSAEEMLSKPWIEFVHFDDVQTTVNIKSTIVNGQEAYNFENRFRCKDGNYKWLSWNSYPDPDEKIMFGLARDVTSIKETEHRLRQIEWMLDSNRDIRTDIQEQNYGDLTRYNKNGLIINSIRKDVLSDIANDYLSLLET